LTAEPRRPRDRGFTLIEVIIVVMILGMVMTALAAAFVVIVRATPGAEARADDSRSLNNLTTWLSKDVSSTEETGFTVGVPASGCTGVPTSTSLLELRWSEGSTTYVANYRYLATGPGTGVIHRFSCKLGQAAADLRLTPDLTDASSGSLMPAPVAITLVHTTNGNPGNKGLQFVVTVLDEHGVQRELLSLDATTSNVHTTLPAPGGGSGSVNDPPSADQGSASVALGQAVNLDLDPLINDPEGEQLTVTLDTTTLPSGLTAAPPATGSSVVTITADVNPPLAPGTYTFGYTVTDPGSPPLSASNVVHVTVTDPHVNQPPTALAASTNATRGMPVTVHLNVTDPEDGTHGLSVDPPTMTGWTFVVNGLDVDITPPVGATGTTVIPYTARDEDGGSTQSTITVRVCTVTILSVVDNPVDVFKSGSNIGRLKKDVTVTISTNNACNGPLLLTFKPKVADTIETTVPFGTGNTAFIDKSAYIWDTVTRAVALNVRQGANGPVEATTPLQVNA
jgi:prepilin-type N-terminal cleavage/methylation domain-containing protein